LRIIREMEIEKKVNDENKIKLVNLQQQHDLLIEKNGEIIKLETANQLKTQVEESRNRVQLNTEIAKWNQESCSAQRKKEENVWRIS